MSKDNRPERSHELPVVIDGSEPTAVQIVWRNVWVRAVFYVLLTIALIALALRYHSGYAFALQVGIIGFLIAYVLHPVVAWLGRLRVGRGLATGITYGALLVVMAFGSLVISQVVTETGRLVQLIPSALDNMGAWFNDLQAWVVRIAERLPDFLTDRLGEPDEAGELATQVREQFQTFLQQLVRGMQQLLQRLITGGPGMLISGATAVISTTFQIFLILLVGAYFLYDFPRFVQGFRRLIPVRHRRLADDLMSKADLAVGGYLRGQLLITSLLGIMIWIGLSLIGIPLATAISFLAAVFNLVPYLGPILGVVPAVLLGFTISPWAAVLAVLVFTVANQLEAHVLGPLILSRNTNLHPVTVMLSIMAGVGLMGLVGALIAVPLAAMVKVIIEDYVLVRPAFTGVPRGTLAPHPVEGQPATASVSDAGQLASSADGGEADTEEGSNTGA